MQPFAVGAASGHACPVPESDDILAVRAWLELLDVIDVNDDRAVYANETAGLARWVMVSPEKVVTALAQRRGAARRSDIFRVHRG
ncbi:MAG: hypothetical protein ACR2MQ_09690 [Gemmatimonadaceae bacterium]